VQYSRGCSTHKGMGAVLTRIGCRTHEDWVQDSQGVVVCGGHGCRTHKVLLCVGDMGAGLTRCCCVWGTWVQYSQGPGCSTHKDLGAVLTRTWMQYSQGLGAVLTRTWMQDSRGCRTHEVLLCVGDISAGLTRVQNSQGSHDVDDRSPFQRQQSTA